MEFCKKQRCRNPLRIKGLFLIGCWLWYGFAVVGCTHDPYIIPEFSNSQKKVPHILVITPIETSQLNLNQSPMEKEFGEKFQKALQEGLQQKKMLNQVMVWNEKNVGEVSGDRQKLQAKARGIDSSFLLNGSVEKFHAKKSGLLGQEIEVDIQLGLELFDVYTGNRIWDKEDNIHVKRNGSLSEVLHSIVIPSGTAGLIGPLSNFLESKFGVESDPKEDQLLAMLDLELAPPELFPRIPAHDHPPQHQKKTALVVGIERYKRFEDVKFAIHDAKMVKQYLMKAMGYFEQDITFLKNDEATRSQLVARIETWLLNEVKDNPNGEVFVYFGGHGTFDIETQKSYLVPYDGDLTFIKDTAYALERLYKKLGDLPVEHVTVVVDSCFSGVGGRSIFKEGARANLALVKTVTPEVLNPRLTVFTASGAREISSAYMAKRHGLFTYFFLKGMQGSADRNQDGQVTVGELEGYVKNHVKTEARRTNTDQTPQTLVNSTVKEKRIKKPLVRIQ